MFAKIASIDVQGVREPIPLRSINNWEDAVVHLDELRSLGKRAVSFCSEEDECMDVMTDGSGFFVAGYRKPIGSFIMLAAPDNGRRTSVFAGGDYISFPESGRVRFDELKAVVRSFVTTGDLMKPYLWTPFVGDSEFQ